MLCPHCSQEINKDGGKPKFYVVKGYFVEGSYCNYSDRYYESRNAWCEEKIYLDSLKEIYEIIKQIYLCKNKYSSESTMIFCIYMLIENKYTPGKLYVFPEGTYAFEPDENVINNFNQEYRFELFEKYWGYRLLRSIDRSSIDLIYDPKLCMSFLTNNLYKVTDYTPREPPIYSNFTKINPDVYWELCDGWNSIINTTWIIDIKDYIKKLNQNELVEFEKWFNIEIKKI